MMPMTSGMYAMGKIVGPILCEVQVSIAGVGMIFYTLLVITAILMFTVIVLNKHLRHVEKATEKLIADEDS